MDGEIHITAQHPTPNSTPVVPGLFTLPASLPPILTPTLRNLHKRFLRKSGSSSPQSGQSQIGVKHGKPCKCGMLAGPLGWATEKSGHVRRLRLGLQGWWSSSLRNMLGSWFDLVGDSPVGLHTRCVRRRENGGFGLCTLEGC